jgi:hypothetical protein
MLAHACGRDVVPHRPVPPPHLSDRRWRFICPAPSSIIRATRCGATMTWKAPRKQCLDLLPVERRARDRGVICGEVIMWDCQ